MMTILELQKGYREGSFSVRQAVESFLERIKKLDQRIGAFITVCYNEALDQAEQLDQRLSRGENIGPLGGIPVAVKDNICTKNIRTTCASRMLENFVAPCDARVVENLKKAGAVIIGKTNMDEFAMGAASGTSAYKKIANPWNLSKVPGGSSGGSAAAVAAGFAPLALGSDTGGSIRQPASFCGVVGLKPTYGAVSREGLIAFAPSFDTIGPMASTVKDCELLFNVIKEQNQSNGSDTEEPDIENSHKNNCTGAFDARMQNMRIGMPKECLVGLDQEAAQIYLRAEKIYRDSGARVEWFSLPEIDACASAYFILSSAEAASSLARYDGIRYGFSIKDPQDLNFDDLIRSNRTEGFGDEVRRRILFGTCMRMPEFAAYYEKAEKIRKNIKQAVNRLFGRFDLILMPTSPVLPFDIKEKHKYLHNENQLDKFTAIMNLAGIPALSLPGGFSRTGLPVGLQLAGDYFTEDKLFRAASCLEQKLGVYKKLPCLEGDQA